MIESWILNDKKYCASFIAGYVDAEGTFILNQSRARFQIDTYDFGILNNIKEFLFSQNIRNKFRCIAKKGARKIIGGTWNNNLWRLNINEAHSLKKFIKLISPHLRHEKRKMDALICLNNIQTRIKNGTV